MSPEFTDIPVDQEHPSAHYELNGAIGVGSFANVVVGVHILTQTKVAVKIIKQRVSDSRCLLEEVRCMADLHHPNIIQLFHVLSWADSLYLVMEFMPGGDIQDYLNDHGRMSEDTARGVFRQLVSAVHYCHTKGVVHRDLKPENVMLDAQMKATLVDFGLGASSKVHQRSTFCGSLFYTAPELFLGDTYDGCAADIWSLGALLYEILTDTVPFHATNCPELRMKVASGRYVVPRYLSIHVANLLQKLLNLNPAQRNNLQHIMTDPWLNLGQEEELKPYEEPPNDDIDTWVIDEMVNMGFCVEDIKDTLSNKIYNNTLATYRILHRKSLEFQSRVIKVKPFHPPESQSRSPSPAQEVPSEWSGCQQAEQKPVAHEPGQKAQESAGPTCIQEYSITTPESRTTPPPSNPGSKTAIPEPSRESRNASPGPAPPRHCWGSRTSTPEDSQGSRNANLKQRSGSRTAIPAPRRGSRIATPEERSRSRTAIPQPSQGSRTATPEEISGSMTALPQRSRGSRNATPEERSSSRTAIPEHRPGSRTATPELRPGSSTILSPAPQCHPGDSLSSHGTTRSSGVPENIKPRRRQVVRGCLNFLRKLCCLPPKKGSGKPSHVKPI